MRSKIKIIASGKTASSFDLLAKIAAGADVVNAARTMMMAIDVESKSERVKNFHYNTLASFYELVGSMGLGDPAKLVPQMVKRRSPYGAQVLLRR